MHACCQVSSALHIAANALWGKTVPLAEGQIFAGYRIVRLLGAGGMGEVYLAQHPRLPRRDAVKILPAEMSSNAEYRTRFGREADLASTLYHPHIVGVHDRGECDGQLWISMDYVDGLDAYRLMSEQFRTGMPADQVSKIITAVAQALDHAHDRGLLHRDVKPANIMLTTDEERILLTDFGIARSREDVSGLTATNFTVGTTHYAAPEQLMSHDLDGRADQYALAATARYLLTGAHLFPHTNPAAVIGSQLTAPPPPLAESRPELARYDAVLAVALAKQPANRFPRCIDFASDLAAASAQAVPAGRRTTKSPGRSAAMSATQAAIPMDVEPTQLATRLPTPKSSVRIVDRHTKFEIICVAIVIVSLVVTAVCAFVLLAPMP